jgi:acetyl coenzyme A synthetase (ADP forming)-like protein
MLTEEPGLRTGEALPSGSLFPFFQPRAVAVVGASRNPANIGFRLLDALVSTPFQGPVFPVNPRAAAVRSLRAYPSLKELPEPVDLAVIAVPRDAVPGVLDDCIQARIPAAIVISSGFAEVGPEGRELQDRLVEKARAAGIRLIGPNCLGLINTDPAFRLNASFVPLFPPAGRVAMSSDSGALGLALLASVGRLGLGVSSCVSVGNRADVSSNDLLEYWEKDPNTDLILLYLESFGNPQRFARIARHVGRRKPIVAVKAGRTRAGRRAASSHTAALAISDVAVEALFHQTGVIRAESLEELFDLAAALASQPLPAGRRVAIVSNAGGPAILCADAAEAAGLVVLELSEPTRVQLAAFLPPSASTANPVDLIASATPEQFRRAASVLLGATEVDALIAVVVPASAGLARAVLREIQAEAAGRGKPVLVSVVGDPETAFTRISHSAEGTATPCYAFPEAPARVLGKLTAYAEWRRQPPGSAPAFVDADFPAARALCQEALARAGPGWLSAEETRLLLRRLHLPVSPGGVARTAEEAAALASSLGFPVAVKLASQRLIHKTEVGGVRLNVPDEAGVRRAFADIQTRLERDGNLDAMEGVLVQPMVADGTEVLLGVTPDPVFGALVAFGLGGIHVEILGDVCFRVAPLTDRDAAEMVRSIRGYRLFQGYRGHPPADVPALEELLLRISQMVEQLPEVRELDLNPVFALPPGQGCLIVDARIRVGPTETTRGNP